MNPRPPSPALPWAGWIASATLMALLVAPRSALSGPASPSRDSGRPLREQTAIVTLDDFEDPAWPDPVLWQLDSARPDARVPSFWPSTCRARSGAQSLWAFGGTLGSISQPCGAGAPAGSVTRAVLNLDLRNATQAFILELQFELWMKMPAAEGNGLIIHYLAPGPDGQPKRVPVFAANGTTGEWTFPPRRLDLLNLADVADPRAVYDLRGQVGRLEFVGLAPQGTEPGAGIFIDHLRLVWEPDPAVPPPTRRPPQPTRTPAPTGTPTRTASPSPSRTWTPTPSPGPVSPTPSAWATVGSRVILLPWLEAPEPPPTTEPTR